ncbi:MAG: TIGR04552 family protein [Cyanobacteria bacterium]|nr:TIGR04552 family protein [Cyanobacteriota bacterium]
MFVLSSHVSGTSHDQLADLHLAWDMIEAMLSGKSSIDLNGVPFRSREDAEQFLIHYGFDWHEDSDRAELVGLFEEAVRFINHVLLAKQPETLPKTLKEIPPGFLADVNRDILSLMMIGADKNHPEQPWACALLKVMHTLAHIQNGPLYTHFDVAKEQILNKINRVLDRDPEGHFLLGIPGPQGRVLPIYAFEKKDRKSRESILVKLLSKKENVAQEVHDMIGLRLVTFTEAEALLALDILRENRVIVFPNIIPSRSRNTLVDLTCMKEQYESIAGKILQGEATAEALSDWFQGNTPQCVWDSEENTNFSAHNPSSSRHYRSIHITCRQLIRVKDPKTGFENRFFYPFEIQITDKASYLENKDGSSAHAHYKERQFALARQRVLGPLLPQSSAE